MTNSSPWYVCRNAATVAWPSLDRVVESPPDARDAYRVALAAERARPSLSRPGHRLYWWSGAELGARDLPASSCDGAYAVVGRHTHCDVVLASDPTLSLRHALARSVLLDDGCPLLSVLDLKTERGFELADGTRQRAIVATGPVVLRMGGYVVVALPSGAGALPPELPPSTCATGTPAGSALDHPYRSPARRHALSSITLLPHVLDVGERAHAVRDARSPTSRPEYALVAQSRTARIHLRVASEDLDRGILLGRAPRCVHAGAPGLFTTAISRVHVLVIREKDGVVAYDVASTHHTFDTMGRRVRRTRLADDGSRLTLASGDDALEVHWRGRDLGACNFE